MLVLAGLSAVSTSVQAQFNPGFGVGIGSIGADPFSGYYSWFLPRQAAMAATPSVNNQLSQYAAERVDSFTESGRAGSALNYANLGIGSATGQTVDDGRPRNPRPRLSATGPMVTSQGGHGAGGYYERASSYYPTLRGSTYRNPGLPQSRRR
jgi:hypothetical protein